MNTITVLQIIQKYLGKSLTITPLVFLSVVCAEGVQHIVEWRLGMYESADMFKTYQKEPIRLSFGILKAISVVAACYFVPKTLSKAYGPPPKFGSFNRDFVRKMWDPRSGLHGMIAMIICAIPLVLIHIKISELAMGHTHTKIILIFDSFLIGVLAVIMGTSVWAGDFVDAKSKDVSS